MYFYLHLRSPLGVGFSHVHEVCRNKVYRGVALFGLAVYDATWGGGRPDKFINAENKIHELVDQLFSTGKSPLLTPTPSVGAAPSE